MKHDIRILKENWENFLKEAHQPHKVTINGKEVNVDSIKHDMKGDNDYLMSLGQAPIKSESSAFGDFPENDEDDRYNNDEINISREFINEMKKNNIFVEENFGKEYFIRCKEHEDFMIYFPDDETIEIYDTKHNSQKQEFRYEDAVDYVLKNKEHLLTFDESVKEIDQEDKEDAQDRKNNRAEMGGGLA